MQWLLDELYLLGADMTHFAGADQLGVILNKP